MSEIRNRPSFLKQRLIVDKKLQYAILSYNAMLGLVTFLAGASTVFTANVLSDGTEGGTLMLVLCALIWALSIVLLTVLGVMVSHRIAGPVFRMRAHMQAIIDGGPIEPLVLRKGDHFEDLQADYNRLIEVLNVSRKKS